MFSLPLGEQFESGPPVLRRLREVKYVTRNVCETPRLFMPLDQAAALCTAEPLQLNSFISTVCFFVKAFFFNHCLMHSEWAVFKHS